jgi:hypothetical protein
MITNTGKNIIARYLIGDAPAYASFLALGCGANPRPNITTKASVSTATVSGEILSTGDPAVGGKFITPVTGITSTAGLVVGMTLTKVSGTGAFGANTTITSIDSPTRITVSSSAIHTAGNLVFNTGGVAQLLSVSSTSGLWVGAKITVTSGTGTLSTVSDTLISAIPSGASFTVTPGPTANLLNANILLEIDPLKKALDFEMFRVPISSRGYVNDNGLNKIVLTAQLPTEERYEISEIGIYSAGANTSAGQYDSKTISAFSGEEGWELSLNNNLAGPSPQSQTFPEVQTSLITGLNVMNILTPAIKTSTSNGIFSNSTRSARYERPRYLSNVLLLRGNTSYIHENPTNLSIFGTPAYLQIPSSNTDLSKNSSSDLIKLAFSLVAVEGDSSAVPDNIKIIIEFSNSTGTQFAQMQINAQDSVYRFNENRYVVATKRLDELVYSTGSFSWKNVEVIKAYVSTTNKIDISEKVAAAGFVTITAASHGLNVDDWVKISGSGVTGPSVDGIHKVTAVTSGTFTFASTQTFTSQASSGVIDAPRENYYIALDALRLDNIRTVNPLYGLTGYSIVQNSNKKTIVKSPNTSNYIEYRFILDVT